MNRDLTAARLADLPTTGAADLLTPAGRAMLGRVVQDRWLLAFDFDGTLAPFVDRPEDAAMPPALFQDLATLAARRPVAVLSGRALSDVRPRLPAGLMAVVGNHGGESTDGDPAILAAAIATARCWQETLTPLLIDGLRLENKGASLALHWRGARDPEAAEAIACSIAIHLTPRPRLIAGDQVLNCLPPGMPDKGQALLRLLGTTGCPGALFVGDDITDAAVFLLGDPGVVGIEVGQRHLGAAWRVPDTTAVGLLLQELLLWTGGKEP